MYSPYSRRGWSATHVNNSQEVVLNIRNAKEDDDGYYVLEMHYISSGQSISSRDTITLHVLGKLQDFYSENADSWNLPYCAPSRVDVQNKTTQMTSFGLNIFIL